MAVGRVILERRVVHIPDVTIDPDYGATTARLTLGYRTVLGVPMLRLGTPIGALCMWRRDVRPFTDKQVALLTTFADQAVIAIENVRLFQELEARNRDLHEALEQQTASSEVLKVISRSAFDLQPVLESLVESAVRLCGADRGNIYRQDGDVYRTAVAYGASPEYLDVLKENPIRPGRGSATGRAILERRAIHIQDVLADPEYSWAEGGRGEEIRTVLAVPMLREGAVIGVILIENTSTPSRRAEVRPFTDKQIELLQTFADQAVIAIENVRLFDEVQARTRDLTEALEQQTASSAILRVISTSPTDVQPVFDTIVHNAVALCGCLFANVFRFDGELLHFVASHNVGPEFVGLLRTKYPMPPDSSQVSGRAVVTRSVIRLEDALVDPDYDHRFPVAMSWRRMLGVPMLRQGEPLGVIVVGWAEVGPVPKAQEELLKQFADQAVIAIENVRLFQDLETRTRELARSVEELTALGEVSQAVNSTLELETVLTTIVSRATQLSGTDGGAIFEYDDVTERFHLRATENLEDEMVGVARATPLRRGEGAIGLAAETGEPVQISDISEGGTYQARLRDLLVRSGYRALLAVPLRREDRIIGGLVVCRKAPGEFPPPVIALLTTFATQSALAIQNARLFRELEAKSRELEVASRHKSQFLANMSHELRTPLNAILGYTELILDHIYGEVGERVREVLERVQASGRHLLGLINDVLDLSKIEAGQLRLSLGDYSMSEVVQSVLTATEALAAEKHLALKATVAAGLPIGHGDERRLTQVLLNLVGNAIKFTEAGEVRLEASAANGAFRVSVSDTGPGISEVDQERIFEEFQQVDSSATRKKSGTGLGLAIARHIVEMHGGRIWVESSPGTGSTFSFVVPIRALPAEGSS
jgi:signal transduction histidine kinase